MEIGVFSNVYSACTIEDGLSRIRAAGLTLAQLNLCSVCGELMPAALYEARLTAVGQRAQAQGIHFVSLAGTFNLIAPDPDQRREGLRRFEVLCQAAALLGIPTILLCTGSRNPQSQWQWHPDNASPAAWNDLLKGTERLLALAERYDLVLGVEPEPSNVVSDPQRARTYLDEFRSDRLKIVLDGANLFRPAQVSDMRQVLDEGIGLLARDIIQAHAKDFLVDADGTLRYVAAGKGLLDYPYYLAALRACGFFGPLLLHGLNADEVADSARFLRGVLHA